MLIQFRFGNFKSFKDEMILDLSATRITENQGSLISIGGEKLLPAAAIFGANASGKSNVIEAFRYMSVYVVRSFSYGGDERNDREAKRLPYMPFLFASETRNAPSSFEVYFIIDADGKERTYDYGFTVEKDGIAEEWLNAKARTAKEFRRIFYRSRDELDLSGLSEADGKLIGIALEKETLVVSLGAKLRIGKLKAVRDWFMGNEIVDFGDPFENAYVSSVVEPGFIDDKAAQDAVSRYLASFDRSIVGLEVKRTGDDENSDVEISTRHLMDDGTIVPLLFSEESAGTRKMFALYPYIKSVMENGGALFVDELNSRLHPLLVRSLLVAFTDPDVNRRHAQIIFTTHDTWALSNDMLRRDEIWFTDKDSEGVSTLYSLADFVDDDGMKIRKDESYEKNYLLGKYGAIPELRGFELFTERKNG